MDIAVPMLAFDSPLSCHVRAHMPTILILFPHGTHAVLEATIKHSADRVY